MKRGLRAYMQSCNVAPLDPGVRLLNQGVRTRRFMVLNPSRQEPDFENQRCR